MAKKRPMTEAERDALADKQKAEWQALSKDERLAALKEMEGDTRGMLRRVGFLNFREIYDGLPMPQALQEVDRTGQEYAKRMAADEARWNALPREERLAQIALAHERYLAAARAVGMSDSEIALHVAKLREFFASQSTADDSIWRLRMCRMGARETDVLSQRVDRIQHAHHCLPAYTEKAGLDYYDDAQRVFLAAYDDWKRELQPSGAVDFATYAVGLSVAVKVAPSDSRAEREAHEEWLWGEPEADSPDASGETAQLPKVAGKHCKPGRKYNHKKATCDEAKRLRKEGRSWGEIKQDMKLDSLSVARNLVDCKHNRKD